MKFNNIVYLSLFVFLASCSQLKIEQPEITKDELFQHINYLASDSLKGRKPGTPEGKLAAAYIADQFSGFGYKPFGEDMFQYFEVVTNIEATEKNVLKSDEFSAELMKDFIPLNISSNANLKAEVIFCGYGFDIDTDEITWNDYNTVDVKDKWVLIILGDPELENPDSKFIPFSGEHSKVITAKDHGAKGILLVSGVDLDAKDQLMSLEVNQTEANFEVPVFNITREFANRILKKSGKTIEKLEKNLKDKKQPLSFSADIILEGNSELVFNKVNTQNVVAVLEGNDPELKNEYIIIGGHYDHLGFGGSATSSRMPDTVAVHFGADDNASGVASLIELSEKIAANKDLIKRSVILLAFGAEEIGVIGSKYFTANPSVDLKDVKAMVNIDMVGRLKESKELLIGGVGTSAEGEQLLNDILKDSSLVLSFSYEGFGPSDHAAFYSENVPVFFFSTGAHQDYHTPNDVIDEINFEGLKRLSDYIYDLSFELINSEKVLTFQESGPKFKTKSRRAKITLGIMPNFGKSENDGLRVDGVTPGKPAEKGGMKKGDVIVAIEGKPVHNIYDYMERMSRFKKDQIITVDVMRDQKKEVLLIQL